MTPTVKRMKKAHGFLLVVCRTAFHDGADQHLDDAAADGVYDDGKQDSRKGIHNLGHEHQHEKSRCGTELGNEDRRAIAYLIDEQRG